MLIAGALLAGCNGKVVTRTGSTSGPRAPVSAESATEIEKLYEHVVATVLPSVVQIDTDQGEGSGVVFDDLGHIVTNAHVVAGAKRFQVLPSSGGKPLPAKIVGEFQAGDLAVIRVTGTDLHPARFGDSSALRVGQMVLAMGSPLGLSGSVTNGIISATGRTVTSQREGTFPGATIASAIQTSAAINPGNSGGALVTMNGQVVGIPTLAAGTSSGAFADGIGFAIPSETVMNIAPQLIKLGKVTSSGRAALGVTIAQTYDPISGESGGIGLVGVTKGGSADNAGLKKGDVILSVNGTPTVSTTALSETLANLKPGRPVKIEVRRGDTKKTVDVTLGELPGSLPISGLSGRGGKHGSRF
jgi:putative serine protease PepD